jgi:hypothetical protein
MSREIDALIAEHVMGHSYGVGTAVAGIWYPRPDGSIEPYSTDIAAAWQVVEKVKDTLTGFGMVWHPEKQKWHVMYNYVDFNKPYFSEADTAPMAICLAALDAAGVEVPKR